MITFLLLLEFRALLLLLCGEPLLLLLVFLIQSGVPCVGSRAAFHRWKVLHVDRRTSRMVRGIRGALRGSPPCFSVLRFVTIIRTLSGGNDPPLPKCRRFRSGSHGRPAMILRSPQLSICAGGLHVLDLSCRGSEMPLVGRGLFWRRRPCLYSVLPSVVADARHRVIHHPRAADIVNNSDVDVVYGTVVEEVSVLPTSAFVAIAEITESVNDAAIKADLRAPIAIVENIGAVLPSPIARRPEETDLRGQNPRTRHPVVIVEIGVPSPVARHPDVVFTRANRLLVNGEWRRGDQNGDAHLAAGDC